VPELPAREVHSSRPDNSDLPSISIDCDRLVTNRPEPQSRDKASLRGLTVARRAYSPPGTALDFGRIDTQETHAPRAAVKGIAIDDIGAWTVEHCWMLPSGFIGCNTWEHFALTTGSFLEEPIFEPPIELSNPPSSPAMDGAGPSA
jgi:hypothetical protein